MAEESLKYKTKIGMYWSFLNNAANQIMQFGVGIVMARLLSPEDFGITALPAVFMTVASIFIDSGFTEALIRKPDLTEKDLSTSFYYSIAMGLFMYTTLFFTAPFIAIFYNTPILTPLIRVTALTFLWGPLNTPQNVILSRKLDFKTRARISITNKIFSGALGITVAYAGYGLWALVVAGVSSSLLGLIQTWWVVKWVPKEKFNHDSFKYLWDYGNKIIGVNLIDKIYDNIAPVIIGKYYSPRDLGVYNRAEGYSIMPTQQILGVLGPVTFPVLSKMQDDNEALRRNYRKMIRVSAFVSFPVFFMMIVLAKPLVVTIVTDKWLECVPILQILCFERMWWSIQCLNKNLLQVKGRSDLFLRVEIIKKPILLLITISTLPFGIICFCYGQIVAGIISLLINTYYTGKIINVGIVRQLLDVVPSLFLSLLASFFSSSVLYLFDNDILQLLIGAFLGCVVYLLGSVLFKFEELNDLKYLIKVKKNR